MFLGIVIKIMQKFDQIIRSCHKHMPSFAYELLKDSALPGQGPEMMLSRTCPSRLDQGSQAELRLEDAHLSAVNPYFAVQHE